MTVNTSSLCLYRQWQNKSHLSHISAHRNRRQNNFHISSAHTLARKFNPTEHAQTFAAPFFSQLRKRPPTQSKFIQNTLLHTSHCSTKPHSRIIKTQPTRTRPHLQLHPLDLTVTDGHILGWAPTMQIGRLHTPTDTHCGRSRSSNGPLRTGTRLKLHPFCSPITTSQHKPTPKPSNHHPTTTIAPKASAMQNSIYGYTVT